MCYVFVTYPQQIDLFLNSLPAFHPCNGCNSVIPKKEKKPKNIALSLSVLSFIMKSQNELPQIRISKFCCFVVVVVWLVVFVCVCLCFYNNSLLQQISLKRTRKNCQTSKSSVTCLITFRMWLHLTPR